MCCRCPLSLAHHLAYNGSHAHTHARAQVTDPNKAAAKGDIDLLRGLTAAQLSAAKDLRGWR
jgi:hypothetical protein